MKGKGISQEALKLIACLTMLVDHIAAAMAMDYDLYMRMGPQLYLVLRGIGRVAFPIYCFLMAEGAHHTRSPGRYALRLLVGAVLSEIPFDLALFGGISWMHQSVMVTLLLGFGALWLMKKCGNLFLKILASLPFIFLGDLLMTDYGSFGVLLIAMLGFFRDLPMGKLMQCVSICLVCALIPSFTIRLGIFEISLELIGCLSVFPILLYFGHKQTQNKIVQWAFYLFYPVHLLILALMM